MLMHIPISMLIIFIMLIIILMRILLLIIIMHILILVIGRGLEVWHPGGIPEASGRHP